VGRSRVILESLLDDLSVYLNDNTIIYERYRQNPNELETRQDIPRARIALYEQSEQTTVKVDDEKANLSRQRYGVDISVVRAYNRDDASVGELPLADLRDAVVDWARQMLPATVCKSYIYSFGYDGSTAISRGSKYVTMTLNFSSIRDLQITQDLPT